MNFLFYNRSLIVFNAFIRIINSKYLIKIPHVKRIAAVFVGALISDVILIVSTSADKIYGFYFSLVGSVLCGMMQAFGESVVLGKSFIEILICLFS